MRYFEAFTGVGGFSLGIQYALDDLRSVQQKVPTESDGDNNAQNQPHKWECVGFSEIDKYASAVLKHHYPNTTNYGDVTKIDWSTVPDFDLLVGGSPCQDFSVAGKRAGLTGARSGLAFEFIRALEKKRPDYFIWENVKGVLSSNRGWDFGAILNQMAEAGYSLWWQVLNAKDFGVPQNRERVFVVGTRNRSPREVLFERTTSQEAVIANTIRTGGKGSLSKKHAWDLIQVNQPRHSSDRVYSDKGISPTLNTMQGGMRQPFITNPKLLNFKKDYENCVAVTATHYKEPAVVNGVRRITPVECMRLMSWPDGWCDKGVDEKGNEIVISDSQKYRMAGNGVVSRVVTEIVKAHLV